MPARWKRGVLGDDVALRDAAGDSCSDEAGMGARELEAWEHFGEDVAVRDAPDSACFACVCSAEL